ncbi:hypothetical protein ACFQH9_10755 [Pseudonocardia lutea]|uniref:Uncharacterized protein n=1 Tax=Pseudonocardia lutea TaxID=2172015 RepID=A0ABW1I917_9PSEU
MTTTPHDVPGRTGRRPAGPGSLTAGLGHPGALVPAPLPAPVPPPLPASVPPPRLPEGPFAEQPFLRFPTPSRPPGQEGPFAEQPCPRFPAAAHPAPAPGRRRAPAAVLATRIVGLCLTVLCALAPAYFALMAIAFGLGLGHWGGVAFGGVIGAVAIAWPAGFWWATTRARRVWPVLLALVPAAVLIGAGVWLWIIG